MDSSGQKIADRGNKALSTDVVKLLKTQDAGYIRTMLQVVRKERKRLEEEMVLGAEDVRALKDGEEQEKWGKHTVFVGDRDEQMGFKPDEWFGTGEEHVDRVWNRPRKGTKKDGSEDDENMEEAVVDKKLSKKQQEIELQKRKEERALRKKRERTQERRLAHLEAVKSRERDLMIAEDELEKQRAKMNGSIGGVNKNGVKYKVRERKR